MADTCQNRISNGRGRSPSVCGKDARWVKPSGDVVTVLIYEATAGKMVSLCCAPTASRLTKDALDIQHPEWKRYKPAPERAPDLARQQWMRHALEDTGTARQGGLVRADNSDDNLRHMPVQPYLRRVG
jgi:hypothetical protein